MKDWYPERPPQFDEPGEFEAIIYASDRPPSPGAKGRSYAAFGVKRKDTGKYEFGVVESGEVSEEYRGYVAAAVGVVESLPAGSKALIRSHHKQIIATFNDYMPKWKRDGWAKKDKQPIVALEIFQRFDTVVTERSLIIEPFEWIAKNDYRHYGAFNRLASMIDTLASPSRWDE